MRVNVDGVNGWSLGLDKLFFFFWPIIPFDYYVAHYSTYISISASSPSSHQ